MNERQVDLWVQSLMREPKPKKARKKSMSADTYEEWRLTGQPLPAEQFAPYDCTARAPQDVAALKQIWHHIQAGEYRWRDARLSVRTVTVSKSRWADVIEHEPIY